jgi:hypothetical protein
MLGAAEEHPRKAKYFWESLRQDRLTTGYEKYLAPASFIDRLGFFGANLRRFSRPQQMAAPCVAAAALKAWDARQECRAS